MTSKRAFTLIELLVVITIIAILAGLLFPVFSQAKFAAKKTQDISNLHQIGVAFTLYMADYDDLYPWGRDPTDLTLANADGASPLLKAAIPTMQPLNQVMDPYSKSAKIWESPVDQGTQVYDPTPDIDFVSSPTMFKQFGMSYVYRTEIPVEGVSGSSLADPTSVNVLFSGGGHWLGTGRAMAISDDILTRFALLRGYRYDILYGDFHTKVVPYDRYMQGWHTTL